MNAVGIDISKGKSMIAVMRPFGEVVAKPFEVSHTAEELKKLADYLHSLEGDVRVLMEYTGKYYQPIARVLYESGFFVSVVHAKLIHSYGNHTIRKVKTDKADAVKIANYAIDRWTTLTQYSPEDDIRLLLKTYNRQYQQYMKQKVALHNNLIAILDQTFPGVNTAFSSPVRADGRVKWVDFTEQFWHCKLVADMSLSKFTVRYNKWCQRNGYHRNDGKAAQLYELASTQTPSLPRTDESKVLVTLAVSQLRATSITLAKINTAMSDLAKQLPEYSIVLAMGGVGEILGPQLIAEIGDVTRFPHKGSLVAFAGVDAPPFQSGAFNARSRNISKRGSPALRKALFQVMQCLLLGSPSNDPVYQFLDRKRAEGKHYFVYMVAGCGKFLRIYFARVNEYLASINPIA